MVNQDNPAVVAVIEAANACIEAAERNADGSDTYCIAVEIIDSLSAALTRLAGGL